MSSGLCATLHRLLRYSQAKIQEDSQRKYLIIQPYIGLPTEISSPFLLQRDDVNRKY